MAISQEELAQQKADLARGYEAQREVLEGKENFPAAQIVAQLAREGILTNNGLSPEKLTEGFAQLSPRERVYAILEHFVPEPHHFIVERPEQEEVPVNVKNLPIAEADQKDLKEGIAWVQAFVDAPIIHDDFGSDHASRGAWREKLCTRISTITGDEKTGDYVRTLIKYNKLRTNWYSRLMEMSSVTPVILEAYPQLNDITEAATNLLMGIPPECMTEEAYRDVPQEEKVRIAREVSQLAETMIRAIQRACEARA